MVHSFENVCEFFWIEKVKASKKVGVVYGQENEETEKKYS